MEAAVPSPRLVPSPARRGPKPAGMWLTRRGPSPELIRPPRGFGGAPPAGRAGREGLEPGAAGGALTPARSPAAEVPANRPGAGRRGGHRQPSDPHPQGVPGSAGPPSWRQPDSPLRGVPSGISPQLLRPPSQSPRAPRPCLNSSPRVLSSNFQPLPLGITGPTQLEEAFSLTPGLPRNTPRRHMTKLLPRPCRPSPPPQTTSRGRGGLTGCTLALQGLMAPALLFFREKPTPLLFVPATLGREDGQMQRQRPPGSSPCPLRTLTFSHGAQSHTFGTKVRRRVSQGKCEFSTGRAWPSRVRPGGDWPGKGLFDTAPAQGLSL